ncbi:hypothetical protein BDC45DRAFT_531972 [Circinella umbellata]|nr:hypothetical protein BDC45DRAFT_531972 [Circinella umbellata]
MYKFCIKLLLLHWCQAFFFNSRKYKLEYHNVNKKKCIKNFYVMALNFDCKLVVILCICGCYGQEKKRKTSWLVKAAMGIVLLSKVSGQRRGFMKIQRHNAVWYWMHHYDFSSTRRPVSQYLKDGRFLFSKAIPDYIHLVLFSGQRGGRIKPQPDRIPRECISL